MPRALRPRAKVFIKATPPHLQTRQKFPKDGDGPRLWNAKRRIQTSKGLPMIRAISLINDRSKEGYLKWPEWRSKLDRPGVDGKWWKLDRENLVKFMEQNSGLNNLSEDVKEFFLAGSNNLSWSEVLQILLNPPKYFSKPHNVPFSMRKQVYFPSPDDTVVLMRTPHLGPRYAAFDVPLTFNKIDMKCYLKEVYNVDVLHVRSAVFQHSVERKPGRNQYSRGQAFRPPNTKKMTCLLAKPFVYPEEPRSLEPWQQTEYWTSTNAMVESQREGQKEWSNFKPDDKHRNAMAMQAQQMLRGKLKWAPTWTNFEADWRARGGLPEEPQEGAQQQQQQPAAK